MRPRTIVLFAAAILVAVTATAGHTASPQAHWVYLADRGPSRDLTPVVSARALERRARRGVTPLVDEKDLPVYAPYVDALRGAGCRVRNVSRWLNAVSVVAPPEVLQRVQGLPFVVRVTPVIVLTRPLQPRPREELGPAAAPPAGAGASDIYGPSRRQLEQIDVIALQNEGYHGEGVIIAILDTGFNLHHLGLSNVDVMAKWDFIFGDSIVENQPGQDVSSQETHGTAVLSTIGGYAPGTLVGPAWNARFALAKTERVWEEVQQEEDAYVRALEWADSLGADIVSSSLGYYEWYTYADMDGNTAVTTVAADIAVSKGITVVTAAGNEGSGALGWPGIIAPADGDSVLAVGAVDSTGVVAYFSSRGPTYDGRIKPDLMAMGVAVLCAANTDSLTFYRLNGTSLATPLAAGAAALVAQIHPNWGPIDIANALRAQASNTTSPNNDYGWGIIDAYASAMTGPTGVVAGLSLALSLRTDRVAVTLSNAGLEPLTVGVERRDLESDGTWSLPKRISSWVRVDVGGTRRVNDANLGPGVYQYRAVDSAFTTAATAWRSVRVPFLATLGQSAPNPFAIGHDARVRVPFSVDGDPAGPAGRVGPVRPVRIDLYDVAGRRVRTLLDTSLSPGRYSVDWDGTTDSGAVAASGVYFYRLVVDRRTLSRKMLVFRP